MDIKIIFDNVPVLLFYKDKDNKFIKVNRATAEFFDLTVKEIEGKSCYDLMDKEQAQRVHKDDLEVINTGTAKRNIIEPIRGGWFRTDKIPQKDEAGNIIGIIGFALDITDQIKLQNELNVARKAIEQAPSTIVITNLAGDITFANDKFSQVTGYDYKEVLGQNPRILKSGKMPNNKYKEIWDTISAGKVWRGEFINRTKSGELYWELATIAPVLDDHGKIKHYVKVAEVLSEMKHTILNIWNVLEYANYYIVILDKKLNIVLCNDMLAKVLGFKTSLELVGLAFTQFVSENDEYVFKNIRTQLLASTSDTAEFLSEIINKNGSKKAVKWFNSWINSDTDWTFCFGVPIRAEVSQEISLDAMREHYRDIISMHRNLIYDIKEKQLKEKITKETKIHEE